MYIYRMPPKKISIVDSILKNKFQVDDTDADILTTPVKKDLTKTKWNRRNIQENQYHSIDLLYLPTDPDTEDKYLLVSVDVATRRVDAMPLKKRDGETTVKAFRKMYGDLPGGHRIFRSLPKIVHMDAGTEFSEVKKFLKRRKVAYRVAATNRHSQQAPVESMNKVFASVLLKLQLHNEIMNQEEDTSWVDNLGDVINGINEKALKPKYVDPVSADGAKGVLCKEKECDVIPLGTLVRVALDYPVGYTKENRVDSKFREGDIRWSLRPAKIENILMYPNQPIRYVVEGYKNNTFSKQQLQVYKEGKKVEALRVRAVPVKILDKKKMDGLLHYLVEWANGKETWVPRKRFAREMPEMARAYEAELHPRTTREQANQNTEKADKPKRKKEIQPKPKKATEKATQGDATLSTKKATHGDATLSAVSQRGRVRKAKKFFDD